MPGEARTRDEHEASAAPVDSGARCAAKDGTLVFAVTLSLSAGVRRAQGESIHVATVPTSPPPAPAGINGLICAAVFCAIGVGVFPGAGATLASFFAYDAERRLRRPDAPPGDPAGIAASESANNAACTGSFVPLLSLGIPGSGTTAVLLGVMIGYGIQPGPQLIANEPAIFWGVIVSMYIGNVVLLMLNFPLIPYLARLVQLAPAVLVPFVLLFALLGVYLR
jgi:TctA family transporter